jgi:hypothetical protein
MPCRHVSLYKGCFLLRGNQADSNHGVFCFAGNPRCSRLCSPKEEDILGTLITGELELEPVLSAPQLVH